MSYSQGRSFSLGHTQSHLIYHFGMNFPGYEYDEKQQCYFRIPPKHFERYGAQKFTNPNLEKPKDKLYSKTDGIYHFLHQRQVSVGNCAYSLRLLNERVVSSMKKKCELKLDHDNITQFDDIVIDEAGELLAVKYTSVDNSSYSDLYQLEDSKFGYVLSKIWTSISLTPVEKYYSMGLTTDEMDFTHFFILSSNAISSSKFRCKRLLSSLTRPLAKSASSMIVNPRSSSWNQFYYTVGYCNGDMHVFNCDHKISYKTHSLSSSILSLTSSLEDPFLFTGHRNGTCCMWDTRLKSSTVITFKEQPARPNLSSSIIGLHSLSDQKYIISNALNSNLSMWDLRMQRKLLIFQGHVNKYKNCKSVLDKLGSFLTAVGSDGFIRTWSTWTGSLLHSLHKSPNTELSHITFTDCLGGCSGQPSFLVTENNHILMYCCGVKTVS